MNKVFDDLSIKVCLHLNTIYPDIDQHYFCQSLLETMGFQADIAAPLPHNNNWDESDIFVITYGDSIYQQDESSLKTLKHFFNTYVQESVTGIHILPFNPYSSDDGFAVIDYYAVNETLGSWQDIRALASEYKIMADLVINHCSSESQWFKNYQQGLEPGKGYFFEASLSDDLSAVVRPRTHPLLRETMTPDGKRYVWCTFSHDQVDLDFSNPQVLLEFLGIIRYYMDNNISVFRLDAVAFLWKTISTPCIHLEQTHELIRLLRLLIEHKNPKAVVITETNVPNRENLTYFGNANEAHAIYNFALPPLLVNTLITGNCIYLKNWMMSLPPAQNGTAYFNFIASHDGIGLRPIEGILSEQETDQLINTMIDFGGCISWRAMQGGKNKAYEMNISLYEALSGTVKGRDEHQQARFLSAHAIMLAIEGIPAIYIHSLLATLNDQDKVAKTQHNRSINRHQWDYEKLQQVLSDENSHNSLVFKELIKLIDLRKQQAAFHPNATQYTLHLNPQIFAFWRQSPDRKQSIFAINNISDQVQSLALTDLNLIDLDTWTDLIRARQFDDVYTVIELKPYQTLWLTNVV